MAAQASAQYPGQFRWSGYLLGFALGGFFDGILLHQVLQWHHLLSGLEQVRHDIRLLILADGLFHMLMYAVAVVGLWLLWRSRHPLAHGSRGILGNALLGFGVWHVVDAVLSHWVLGLHRIRMDVDNPLAWDLVWLAAFGAVPLLTGWLLNQRDRPQRPTRVTTAPLALVFAVLASGAIASRPQPGDGQVMVLFAPGTSPQAAYAAVRAARTQLIWTDPSQQLWAVEMPSDGDTAQFYWHGAILVSNSILPLGCFDWVRRSASPGSA
jgi:uncharacterized membrane protein